MYVEVCGSGDSGCSGEVSVVRLIILWILSRVRRVVGGVKSCRFWCETAKGLSGELKMTELEQGARADNSPLPSRQTLSAAVMSGLPTVWRVRGVGVSLWVLCHRAPQTKFFGCFYPKSST